MIGATAGLALSALLRNKMRSTLTILGIVIGVGAVVTMQAMGRGATAYVGEAISGLGSNMLLVVPGVQRGMGQMAQGVPLFTLGDVDVIRRQAHDVAQIAPASVRMLRAVAESSHRSVSTGGVTAEYFAIRAWGADSGRVIGPEDERSAAQVCVIGRTVRDELFAGQDAVGRELRIQDMTCRIIGVLESKGATAGMDQDDSIFMPFSTFSRRIMGNERAGILMVSASSEDRMDAAKAQIVDILRRRRHIQANQEDDFSVRDPRELMALLQNVTGMLTTLLAGVAAISLLVGGIGIMNIMLVSVTERTREIGVRLAVGARSGDILGQFLVEATTLSAAGGFAGVALGLLGGYAISRTIHIPFVVPGTAAPIALGISVLVGVVFGVVPARKAAHLNPLAALRFE